MMDDMNGRTQWDETEDAVYAKHASNKRPRASRREPAARFAFLTEASDTLGYEHALRLLNQAYAMECKAFQLGERIATRKAANKRDARIMRGLLRLL